MLVFIDESGDSGLKIDKGSSKLFTITLVVFEDNEEAIACDKRIQLLKKELKWTPDSEFHFKKNSDVIRKLFLEKVIAYNFFYYGIVIDKELINANDFEYKNKKAFYKYICGLVFENAKEKLIDAVVVIDDSGNREFRRELSKYLKNKMNKNSSIILEVKMQESHKNNLLQLADYVASVINRSISNTKVDSQTYRKIISRREIYVQVWPKM